MRAVVRSRRWSVRWGITATSVCSLLLLLGVMWESSTFITSLLRLFWCFFFFFVNQCTCVKFWHLLQCAAPPHWQLSVQGGAAGDVSTPGQTLNLHFQDGRGAEEGKCQWRAWNEEFARGIARMVREMPSRSFTRVRHGSACLCRQWRRSAAKRKQTAETPASNSWSFPPLRTTPGAGGRFVARSIVFSFLTFFVWLVFGSDERAQAAFVGPDSGSDRCSCSHFFKVHVF